MLYPTPIPMPTFTCLKVKQLDFKANIMPILGKYSTISKSYGPILAYKNAFGMNLAYNAKYIPALHI